MHWTRLALPLAVGAALSLGVFTAASAAGTGSASPLASPAAPAQATGTPTAAAMPDSEGEAITDPAVACTDTAAHPGLPALCGVYNDSNVPPWAKQAIAKVILRLANGEQGRKHHLIERCRRLLASGEDLDSERAKHCRRLLGHLEEHPEKVCRRVLGVDAPQNAPEDLVKRCRNLAEHDLGRLCRRLAQGANDVGVTVTPEDLKERCRKLAGDAEHLCRRIAAGEAVANAPEELVARCRKLATSDLEQLCRRIAAGEAVANAPEELVKRCRSALSNNLEEVCKRLAAGGEAAANITADIKERCRTLMGERPATANPLEVCKRTLASADATAEQKERCKQLLERERKPVDANRGIKRTPTKTPTPRATASGG